MPVTRGKREVEILPPLGGCGRPEFGTILITYLLQSRHPAGRPPETIGSFSGVRPVVLSRTLQTTK